MIKLFFTILSIVFCSAAIAQSPSLSVQLVMDKSDMITKYGKFKIEMKICEPVSKTVNNDWFTNDTSAIIFSKLMADDISCGNYMEEGEGKEVLIGKKEKIKYNSYKYSNQHFAWENILIFKISNQSSKQLQPPMFVVIPISYKSFVTTVKISDVMFRSGNLLFIDNPEISYEKNVLTIEHSLKNETGTNLEKTPFSDWELE